MLVSWGSSAGTSLVHACLAIGKSKNVQRLFDKLSKMNNEESPESGMEEGEEETHESDPELEVSEEKCVELGTKGFFASPSLSPEVKNRQNLRAAEKLPFPSFKITPGASSSGRGEKKKQLDHTLFEIHRLEKRLCLKGLCSFALFKAF